MLNYKGQIEENGDLVIACVVSDLMGSVISKTYKRFSKPDVYPLNTQDELERWYMQSKNKEYYLD